MPFYSLSAEAADGSIINFERFKDQCCLVVNVASKCGLTNTTYKSLTKLVNTYPDLKILVFPCNQFLEQEPGTMCEIKDLITNYSDKFIIFNKVDVNDKNRHPVYKFLVGQKGGWFGEAIKWNFTKFLINKKGEVVHRYGPLDVVSENDKYLIKAMNE